MTEQDRKHLDQIKEDTSNAIEAKYIKGNAEHGGHLYEKPCLNLALDEITDLNTYFRTALKQQEKAIIEIEKLIKELPVSDSLRTDLVKIYNLLKYGNKEGTIYDE